MQIILYNMYFSYLMCWSRFCFLNRHEDKEFKVSIGSRKTIFNNIMSVTKYDNLMHFHMIVFINENVLNIYYTLIILMHNYTAN